MGEMECEVPSDESATDKWIVVDRVDNRILMHLSGCIFLIKNTLNLCAKTDIIKLVMSIMNERVVFEVLWEKIVRQDVVNCV